MKIVTAIDSFKGSMTSMEAGQAAAEGIQRVDVDAEVIVRPLADGGEGTVEALVSGMNGTLQKVQVTGPLGKPVICEYGIIESTKTAVIEMAGAAGITLVSDEERNPLNTTTYGVGEVIRDAIDKGCRRFLVGIGGSATNDGGVGMLQALGYGFLDKDGNQVPFGAKGLKVLEEITDTYVLPELKECKFKIACDVTNALCGEQGCRRFLVGIGGSATNDGGVGMLQALGYGFLDKDGNQVPFGAKGLKVLEEITDTYVLPELKECKFKIACDVTNALCGEQGCSAVFGPPTGAFPIAV